MKTGELAWIEFGPKSMAFLGRIESINRKKCYVFFFNSWNDLTPHGGGFYPKENVHPITGLK